MYIVSWIVTERENYEKISFERLSYKFDKEMAKGTIAMVRMLFIITLLVVLIAGVIAAFFTDEGGNNLIVNIWLSLMHAIDAGTLAGDSGSFGFILIMTIVTICGIFVTSVLIGIINSGLETKLETLRKGKSKVLEENHIVILGFRSNILTIISQIIEERSKQSITQEELALRVGTQKSNISRLESGTYNPSLDFLIKIAHSLGKEVKIVLS